MGAFKDLTGKTFGEMTVIGFGKRRKRKDRPDSIILWKCRCVCGRIRFKDASGLKKKPSCGCKLREKISKRVTKHGGAAGGKLTPEYRSWRSMMKRCYGENDPNYLDYGGKGITVCERWKDFKNFREDMGPRPSAQHSIDRFPNRNGNYEPSNCRWATKKEQSQNRNNVRFLTHNDKTMCVADWARELGVNPRLLYGRLKTGMPLDLVLTNQRHKTGPKQ